jgi:cytochrome d ubiquinol oxidase subunit II
MFAYAALDGFDIGVGCLQVFAKEDRDRRIFMNAIGPVWDSNSLWVVITSGAMLAGFPVAFATLFSGLYLPMMGLVFGYILRGVAIEFRSKLESARWRGIWDWVFSLSSIALAFGYGVVLANLIHGLPIDHQGKLLIDHKQLITPYALLLGSFTTIMFMLHGALYLNLKTEGPLQERIRRWCWRLFGVFLLLWVIVNVNTPLMETHVTNLIRQDIWLLPLIFTGLAGIIGLYYSLSSGRDGWAFISSGCIILSLIIAYALGTYPNLVRSSLNDAYSLSIYNASSTPFTLKILLSIAGLGVPLFFIYMAYSYRVFKGKVELDTMSY